MPALSSKVALSANLLTQPRTTFLDLERYEDGKLLYEKLNFGIDCDSRVAIVGPNGAGKSTMLKLFENEVLPVEGAISRNPKLRCCGSGGAPAGTGWY